MPSHLATHYCDLLRVDCHCVRQPTFHLAIVKLLDQFGATANNASANIPEQESWPTCACVSAGQVEELLTHSRYTCSVTKYQTDFFQRCRQQFALPASEHGNSFHSTIMTKALLIQWAGMAFSSAPCPELPNWRMCRRTIHLFVHSWNSLTLMNPYWPLWYL